MAYERQFVISPRLLSLAETIAGLSERTQGAAVELSWVPAVQRDTRARNVHASTAIEGYPLTLEQVRALEEGRELFSASRDGSEHIPARPRRKLQPTFGGAHPALPAPLRHRPPQCGRDGGTHLLGALDVHPTDLGARLQMKLRRQQEQQAKEQAPHGRSDQRAAGRRHQGRWG